jgi:hypothetical protein
VGVGICQIDVKEFSVLISGPSSLKVGETRTWTAMVKGGKPPYLYTFYWGLGEGTTTFSERDRNVTASHAYLYAEHQVSVWARIRVSVSDDNQWWAEDSLSVDVEQEALHPYTLCQIDYDGIAIDIKYYDAKKNQRIGANGNLVYTGKFYGYQFFGYLQKSYEDYNGFCSGGALYLTMDSTDTTKVKEFTGDIECTPPGSGKIHLTIKGGGLKLIKNDYYMQASATGMQICTEKYITSYEEKIDGSWESFNFDCTDLSYLRIWCEKY